MWMPFPHLPEVPTMLWWVMSPYSLEQAAPAAAALRIGNGSTVFSLWLKGLPPHQPDQVVCSARRQTHRSQAHKLRTLLTRSWSLTSCGERTSRTLEHRSLWRALASAAAAWALSRSCCVACSRASRLATSRLR